ncbi:hypothetical protein FACS1894116_10520 [Betaproteobacteria bacterium]|nr:hypothetical protein FACS1894116_10520 [Betaproteobacteria bacterium]
MTVEMDRVYDSDGNAQMLRNDFSKKGGEGAVYELRDLEGRLVKCYHSHVLQSRGTSVVEKVQAMMRVSELREHNNLCWPRISVYDVHGNWVGFAMIRAVGEKITNLASHRARRERHFPGLKRDGLVAYLILLLHQINELHQCQVMIGDYNTENIFCDPASDRVMFIDCDGYQLGNRFMCIAMKEEMSPPEFIQTTSQRRCTVHTEIFSLAILLFKVLMSGRHPYDIEGGSACEENICKGFFAYGVGKYVPKGPWQALWDCLPDDLQKLFTKTFTVGSIVPLSRPLLPEWYAALCSYHEGLRNGRYDNTIDTP